MFKVRWFVASVCCLLPMTLTTKTLFLLALAFTRLPRVLATEHTESEFASTHSTNAPPEPAATAGTAKESEATVESLTHRLFGGEDPFEYFSPSPFGEAGEHSAFDGGVFRWMGEIENLFKGFWRTRPGPFEPMTVSPTPEFTVYSMQAASANSFVGQDGKIHTEQYATSDVGNRERGIRELHQAYVNSETGKTKRALEQHLGPRDVKTVKERGGHDAAEDTKEILRGMDGQTESRKSFDKDFAANAQHLPEHGGWLSRLFSDSRFPKLLGAASWRSGSALESGSQGTNKDSGQGTTSETK